MNRVYKLVWSKIRNCWIVVSEIAKSHSKSAQNNFVDKRKLDNKICLQLQSGIFNSAIAENNIGFISDANIHNSAIVDRLIISDFKITVAAIVKNEAKNVSQWVKAARSCADEIVVVDTGSTDGTVERFADYGIKCYLYDWNDDFASAKNYMISLCHGDWIVLLDGDEWFRENCDVRKAIAKHHNNPMEKAIIADWICLDSTKNNTIMFSGGAVRAFRNSPEIRYFRKVHENLTLNYENFVFEPDFKMYHTGYSGDVNRSKHERNLRIMRTMFDFDNGKVELPADWRYIQDTYAGLGELEKSLEASDRMLEFDIPELLASSWITRFNVLFQMKVSMERMEKEFDHCFKTVPSVSGFRFLASIFYMVNNKPKKAMDEYCEGIRMLMGVQDRVALENSFWRMYLPKASALISSAFMQIGNVESALTACFVSEFYCGKNELTNIALADIYSVVNKKQRKSFKLSLDKVYSLLSCAKEGLFVAAAVSGVFISSFALPTNVLAACGTLGGENNTTSVCYSYEKNGSYYWVAPSCVSNNTVTVGGVTYTVTKHTPQNSAVVGGVYNNSSGTYTVVVGGGQNHATGIQASVLGGTYNDAVGTNGTVVGGEYNTAGSMTSSNGNGRSATVVGGSFGKATGSFSVQLGGSHSEAKGDYAISIGSAHSYATCSIAIMGTTGTSTCANTAKYSVAIGLGSLTTKNYEIAIGSSTAPITLGGNMTVTGTNTVTDGTISKRWSDILQAGSYTLPTATSSVLGGVKTGSNITNSSGTISLTKANVVSALGYTPPEQDTNTHYTSHIYVGSGTAANAATTNGNTKIALVDDSTVRNTLTIKGTGSTSVTSDANGVITINSTDNNTTYSAMSADELNTGTATTSRAMTAKVVSDYVKSKTDDKITGLSVSGKVITYTKGDGTTGTITTQDSNTTYSAMSADELNTGTATTSRAMTAKVLGDYVKSKTNDKITSLSVSGKVITYTKGDGTTGTITTQDTNTTYSNMSGASASAAGTAGLVPAPAKGAQNYVLHGDGTWKADANTTYSAFTGATSSAAGSAGLVKAPVAGDQAKFLRGDGIWAADNDTHWTSHIYVGSGTAANAATTNGNTKIALADNSTVRNTLTIKGTGATSVTSDANGVITISSSDANTTYSNMTAATASAAGTAGLVPAPAAGKQTAFLRGDGTWVVPTDTNTHYTSHMYVGSGTAANAATTNGNTKIALADDSTVRNTLTIKGTGSTSVTSDANGVITINSTDNNTTYSAMGADELTTGTATTGRVMTAKVVSDYVKSKTNDKITSLSVNGKVITYTKGDGTTGTITTQDTNTTYGNMGAATASAAGTAGLVPAPAKGAQNYVLHGDGTWKADANTTYSAFTGASASAAGGAGLVKAPAAGDQNKFLRGDGTWAVDNNTTYAAMDASELSTGTATTSRTMTAKVVSDYVKSKTDDKLTGLSVSGKTITYTKGDGTTGTITTQDNDTTYGAGTTALLNTGTDTTNKVWTSKALADYVKGESRITADGTFAKKANTAAANITALDTAAKNAIQSLSVSGKVITYTKGDGTTGTITTQDTNTTYSAMGADELTTGTATTGRTVTAKVVSDYVKSKTDDKISNLSVNGNTITYTKGNGTTGSFNLQDTTYTTGNASVLNAGTETAGKLWSGKVLSDYVVGKVNTEANTRSTADTALDNRIGTLSSNGYYIKKSAMNNMATNMTLLDYQLKATNDNITGFASDITRNKNNIATLNTSVSSALSSVGAASSVIDLLSNTKADASLANLNASGKRVIANAAINAVQEYMASQNGTVTPSAPRMYANNLNTLAVNDAGNGSLHVGEGSYVNGTSSIAIGVGNQVNANNAGAFGDPSIINADASYVLGNDDTVNTGAVGSFIVGNDSVSSAKGGLTFGSNNNLSETAENSIALGNNITVNGKNSVALGSNSIAVDDNVVSVGNNTLQRKIVNVLAGDVSENSNEVVTGSQLFSTNEKVKANEDAITQKADLDASNIDVDSWTAKLGVGIVEENNTGLINGGTVFNAIQQVKDNSLIQQNGDILSIGNTIGGSTIDVSNNLGDGRIITGVVTDPDNPYSATNVGYVQSVSENIVNAVNNSFTKMNDKVNKLGANASALAALTPASFEGDEKWSLAASVGYYHGETGGAVGAFYKPTENVMMNIRMAGGNGENMAAAGVAVSLSKGDIPGVTKRQLASEVISLKQNQVRYEQKIAQQDEVIKDLVRRLEAVENK